MKATNTAVTMIGIGTLGIFVAYIFWYLYDNGIWIDQYITVATPIQEIMAVIIVIFLLVGVLVGAMRK